jgi:hypothetical protein
MIEPKLPPDLFSGINTAEFIAEFGDKWYPLTRKPGVWWTGGRRRPIVIEWDGVTQRLHLHGIDVGYYATKGVGLNSLLVKTENRTMEEIREFLLANLDYFIHWL